MGRDKRSSFDFAIGSGGGGGYTEKGKDPTQRRDGRRKRISRSPSDRFYILTGNDRWTSPWHSRYEICVTGPKRRGSEGESGGPGLNLT